RHALEHRVDFARLFAGSHHADNHGRENRMLANRDRDAFSPLDVRRRCPDCLFHYDIAARVRDNVQYFEDWHTAANQRGKGAREPSKTNLVSDGTEDRQFDSSSVPKLATGLCLDIEKP